MNGSGVWGELVLHEWKTKGSWKKLSRPGLSKQWRYAYCLLILLAFVGFATYFAYRDALRLTGLWYVGTGFPYMLFFLGYGMLKREWENETHGWWLTLPYSRFTLASAKWAAAYLRVAAAAGIVYAASAIYGGLIVLILPDYHMADYADFMLTGLNWCLLILGFAPFILSAGMLTSTLFLTPLKPIGPILLVACMAGAGLTYSGFSSSEPLAFTQLNGESPATFFPFPWEVGAVLAASLVAAYLLLRLSAYLLDRKLSL